MNFDPQCESAIELAKRALPDGASLDVCHVMCALYHATHLKSRLPQMGRFLDEPKPRTESPEKVPVAHSLRPIIKKLTGMGHPVTPDAFFAALLESDTGRAFLESRKMSAGELNALKASISGESGWRNSTKRREAIDALRPFGRMLTETELPSRGVAEMDKPLQFIVRTLSRMRRRNAIITGHSGTGKSALIYELARRIVRGDESIPPKLREYDIFELIPSFLRSGASMVGQYDERVKALLQTLMPCPNIVLFIDEIHSLFQSGVHDRGPYTDANEAFKGVLAKGEITCIGCTTPTEYRHYIEPDEALARRFEEVRLEPPSRMATVRILQARRPKMEEYFTPLRIPDPMLERTVALAEEYVPRRWQPDKSLQLLDYACACCATANPPAEEVTEPFLIQALEEIVGHPIACKRGLTEEEVYALLRSKIYGQDDVLRGIARAFVAGLGRWARTAEPMGVFLFAGPTGVGKTEVALTLAKILGNERESLVRIDCNTLQGSGHDSLPIINRLLGAPPGYLGYARGQGGILSKVRDLPECIVLFDEFEKADPAVGELLLRILDEGYLEDVDGNLIDFRRSFVVFTSNAGCVYEQERKIGITAAGQEEDKGPIVDEGLFRNALRAKGLGEEFLGRIPHTFLFQSLDESSIQAIVTLHLEGMRKTASDRGLEMDWEPELVSHLVSRWQCRYGVRHLRTILRNRVLEQLSIAEAQGELEGIETIYLRKMSLEGIPVSTELTGFVSRQRESTKLVIDLA